MNLTLDSMRACFEGAVPASIATCAPDGIPNVAYISQVHYVDNQHVALTFQFFNKTRENILINPHAMVQVVDPNTTAHYRLRVRYLRTETEGPLFEYMKARLAGIASHTGMSKVFRLLGSDVYEVQHIEKVSAGSNMVKNHQRSRLAAVRHCTQQLAGVTDLDTLLDKVMQCLQQYFEIEHAMLLMQDESAERLFTVASHGYPESGIGSEIPIGTGLIGVAARERTPIRIMHMANDYVYSLAMRESLRASGGMCDLETEIPFPGLATPHSQLAVPIALGEQLIGVLYVESLQDMRFSFEDEDALMTLANQLAVTISLNRRAEGLIEAKPARSVATTAQGSAVTIDYYNANHSIFIDNEYLIKGVAGAILWKLLCDVTQHQRNEFTNRQLRLDPALNLPEISDNLEARLILLQKRLQERCDYIQLQKTGRGRFRLNITRPVHLSESAV